MSISCVWAGPDLSATGLPEPPVLSFPPAATMPAAPAPPRLSPILPPSTPRVLDPHALIRAAARKNKVPTAFVKSIVAAESNFDTAAVSPKGAIGLMQLMPSTAALFGADPKNPEQNVDAGTRYLRFLINRYHKYRNRNWLKLVIAAYNAGPAIVDRYHGVPPYPETRLYVARVLAFLNFFQHQGT